MKCAAEFIMMKNEAIEAHNTAINAEYEEMIKNAINLCETTINDEFVKRAKNRETLEVKYWIGTYKDELGHEFLRFGTNHSHSNIAKPAYALEPFVDYLHKFCFEVIIGDADRYEDRLLTVYIPKEDSNRTCGA